MRNNSGKFVYSTVPRIDSKAYLYQSIFTL